MNELEKAAQALRSQPFSVLLGAAITSFGHGAAELRLDITDAIKQQHGFVHGGVLSYLADNALTFAGGSALGSGVVTSEFKINYVRPALGTALVARAGVAHRGSSQTVCRCDIYAIDASGGETLVAIAQGTIVRMGSAKENAAPSSGAP